MRIVWLFSILLVLTGVCIADYQIIATFDAPDTNISGLGFGNGSLWAVSATSENAYKINPATGDVQNSWYCSNGSQSPSGLTFANNIVYILVSNNGMASLCYVYDASGSYMGNFELDC